MNRRRDWHKSSHSGSATDCVEVAWDGSVRAAIRDSKCPAAGMLRLPERAFRTFVASLVTAG
ncbi:MAG TPA: DUF397 domain-containing protein [Pseudonocardiaceae bacterium]